jgi:PAS domain-containing protein
MRKNANANLNLPMEDTTTDITTVLSAIVNSSDDSIFAQMQNGTIISWNKGAEAIFGYIMIRRECASLEM